MEKHYPCQEPRLRGKLRAAARQMRHEPTPAEDLLWRRLRGRQLGGRKFHRQYSIDHYIVDFFCSSAALVIEVDGAIHRQQVEADQEREQMLAELGFHVLRFTNAQVLEQTEEVLQEIYDVLSSIEPGISDTGAATGTPSPKSGTARFVPQAIFGEGAGG